METRKVSIIIPVFNTKDYLTRCLQSVCKQTYSNLEIICVDDGSTDGSENIVDEFAKTDSRVIAIHQENSGESAARNAGLKIATGSYIAFMDCDDWVELDMWENMVKSMEEKNVDLVACGYFMDSDQGSRIAENKKTISDEVFGRRDLLQYVYERDSYRAVTSWLWCKLFRREILYENEKPQLFDESIRFGGDLLFFLEAAIKVRSAYYLSRPYYHYYQRSSSTSHTKDLDVAYEIVDVYQRMIDFLEERKIEPQIIHWLKRFKVYRATLVAEQAYEQKDTDVLKRCQSVMEEYQQIYLLTNEQYPDRISRYWTIKEYKL